MKVIICGAGQVGFGIARYLAGEGNDVTVVDRAPDLMRRITDRLDVRPVLGHGSHPQVLEEAGASEADIVIAITASDEVNMVTCQVAKSSFGVPKTIARVRSRQYLAAPYHKLFNDKDIPVDVSISPETEVANAVSRRLTLPGAFDSATFFGGEVEMVGISIHENCPVADTPLNQLTGLFPDLRAVVVGISRDRETYVPDFDDTMQVGDKAFLVTAAADTERTLKIFGHEESEARRIVIVGGGNIGFQVAGRLERLGGRYTVNLIEHNDARAQKIAEDLPRSVVLCGSGLSPELLVEAGVRDTDLVLALTNDDQVNILSIMLAFREGCERGLCLINDDSFLPLASQHGMDTPINPRAVTVSSVLGHVRRGKVAQVHAVGDDGAAEFIEAEVPENSPLIGAKLRDLELSDEVRVGAIRHGKEVIMPRGGSEIKAGDEIVLFALRSAIEKVEHFFHIKK